MDVVRLITMLVAVFVVVVTELQSYRAMKAMALAMVDMSVCCDGIQISWKCLESSNQCQIYGSACVIGIEQSQLQCEVCIEGDIILLPNGQCGK
eukprot:Awhi_evm1s4443